jgi:HEAT repeat protein
MTVNPDFQPEEIFNKRVEIGLDNSIKILSKIIDMSDDIYKRKGAIKYLGLISKEAPSLKKECFETLENVLISDTTVDVKSEAARALGRLQLKRALKPLFWCLKETKDNSELKLSLLKSIREISFSDEEIEIFIKELISSNDTIKQYVKNQLLILSPDLLLKKLMKSLINKKYSNKHKAEIIKLIGFEISSLNSSYKGSSYIEAKYPNIIMDMEAYREEILSEITQILKKEDESLLKSSITILKLLKSSIKEDIVKLLLNDNFIIKKNAIIISGKLQLGETADLIVQNLDSLYHEVSLASIEALGEIGDPSTVSELIDILNIEDISFEYSDIDMKFQIMDAVKKIYLKQEKTSYKELIDYLDTDNNTIKESVAFILGEIGKEEFVHPLLKLLKNRNVDIKKNAIIALGKIGHLDALDYLISIISNQNAYWLIKKVTTDALFNIFQQNWYKMDNNNVNLNSTMNKKLALIIEHLREDDKENFKVKLGLIKLLEKFGDQRALDALIRRVNDFHRVVRIHASNAIKKIEERLELAEQG